MQVLVELQIGLTMSYILNHVLACRWLTLVSNPIFCAWYCSFHSDFNLRKNQIWNVIFNHIRPDDPFEISITHPIPSDTLNYSSPGSHSTTCSHITQLARTVVSNFPRVTWLQSTWSNLVQGPATALVTAFIHHLSGSDLETYGEVTVCDKYKNFIITTTRRHRSHNVKIVGGTRHLLTLGEDIKVYQRKCLKLTFLDAPEKIN